MDKPILKFRGAERHADVNADAIFNALPSVIVVVGTDTGILRINNAGEQFFQSSAQHLENSHL